MLIIGSHVGFNKKTQLLGSLEEALSYGANTFMFYTGAPQNTARSKIDKEIVEKAKKLMQENNIDYSKVIVHAPYIINLCNEEKFDFSTTFLTEEIIRCNELGIRYMVLHPGSHVGLGVDKGIENIIKGLNLVLNQVKDFNKTIILLETMAGKGTEIGTTTKEIKTIIDGIIKKERIGVCLDTCHLNDAGEDISAFDSYLNEFDKTIGIDKIKAIHINDSKNPRGSHKDRHECIGYGTIGFENLLNVIYNPRLEDIPKILETPYIGNDEDSKERLYPPYKFEIEMIKNKTFNPNLMEDIRAFYKK